jgi:Helix-turn-helix
MASVRQSTLRRFELLVGLRQHSSSTSETSTAIDRHLQVLLYRLFGLLEVELEEVWFGEHAHQRVSDETFQLQGAAHRWELAASGCSDPEARRWACGLLADCANRIYLRGVENEYTWRLFDAQLRAELQHRLHELGAIGTLAGLLRSRRRELRLSLERLGALAEVHPNSLRHWERGAAPQPAKLRKLASPLGVTHELLDAASRRPP